MIRIIPADTQEKPQSGDLVFRYVEVPLFLVFEPAPDLDAPPGVDEMFVVDGEQCHCILVAEISALSFWVHWWPDTHRSVEEISTTGHRMHSESTSRRYFPLLSDYKFESGAPNVTQPGS